MTVESVLTGYLKENCYIISKNDKCLIIDPGDDFYKIEKLVGSKKVLAILITHYHLDHVGALSDCIKKYNVDVFVMGDDWKGKFDFLKDYCEVVYLPRTEGISTTQLKEELKG